MDYRRTLQDYRVGFAGHAGGGVPKRRLGCRDLDALRRACATLCTLH